MCLLLHAAIVSKYLNISPPPTPLSIYVCVFVCKTIFQLRLSSSLMQPSDPSVWNSNAWPHFQFPGPSTYVTVDDAICQGEPRRRQAWRFIRKNCGFVCQRLFGQPKRFLLFTRDDVHGIIEIKSPKVTSIRQHCPASPTGCSFGAFHARMMRAVVVFLNWNQSLEGQK